MVFSSKLVCAVLLLGRGDLVASKFVPQEKADASNQSKISTTTSSSNKQRSLTDYVQCGELLCINGGKCADDHNYQFAKPLCDCSEAIEEVPGEGLKRFVGKQCEIEVMESDYCGGSDSFCVNGGTCRMRAENAEDQPCNCEEFWTGRHCEYHNDDVQDCLLSCSGQGTCQHGMNHLDDNEKGVDSLIDLPGTQNFMHCVCNDGYAGPNCEYDYIKCDGRNRFCFHGSTCLSDGSGSCECEAADGGKVAGEFCEYHATDHCTNPNELDQQSTDARFDSVNKMLSGEVPFCVNSGVCYRTMNTEDYYCECDASEWKGKRCEIKVDPVPQPGAAPVSPEPTAQWTDTWAPTIYGSETDWPTTWSPAPAPGPPTKAPFTPTTAPFMPTTSPTTAAHLAALQAPDDDKLSGGGKFGVVIGAMAFLGVSFLLVTCFRQITRDDVAFDGPAYSDSNPYTDEQDPDAAKQEQTPEGPAVEMTRTDSSDSGATESDGVMVNRAMAPATASMPANAPPVAPAGEKDLSQVELV